MRVRVFSVSLFFRFVFFCLFCVLPRVALRCLWLVGVVACFVAFRCLATLLFHHSHRLNFAFFIGSFRCLQNMSDDFTTAAGNAAGKAAVSAVGEKFSCKDINFKEPRTWGWVLGIFATLSLIISGFGQLGAQCPGAGAFAIIFGCILAVMEFFCCFKCCAATKDCATKFEKTVGNMFVKGGAYLLTGIIGIVITALV